MKPTYLYIAGSLAPPTFLASVVIGGMNSPGYSQMEDPVSELGMRGAQDAGLVNAAWAVTGVLIVALGIALWIDQKGPGRVSAALVIVAGAVSAAIAVWFPMDPPGVEMSGSQLGHNVLVAVAAFAFAFALIASARSAAVPDWYRWSTWIALAALIAGGVGAALSGAMDWSLIGFFERTTQTGYQAWVLMTAMTGLNHWQVTRSAPKELGRAGVES